jgi:hypothetical protein
VGSFYGNYFQGNKKCCILFPGKLKNKSGEIKKSIDRLGSF